MAIWEKKSAGRIGNTVELFAAPDGHFRPTPGGARRIWPSRASPGLPDAPHRASPGSCWTDQIRQRHGHAMSVNRP